MTDNQPLSMNIEEIMQLLPHRYPFLLVDRITEYIPGQYAKGYKNVSMNEQFFCGHFPNVPVMPGVLQIEAMAQLSGALVLTQPQYKDKLALFAGIDNARFKRVVKPGDRLDMEVRLMRLKGPYAISEAKAYVDGKLCMEATIKALMVDPE